MANDYDFSTLNDKDLEKLVCDLFNAKFDLQLQSFKSGKDKGVDLRYSGDGKVPKIVVQVKHFYRSGYEVLLSKLKTQELPKVRKLAPQRYIVATSVPLSAFQKDEICHALDPYILTSDDVFGKDDLNRLLRDPKCNGIEQKWHKLWLSSTESISAILNNAVIGRSDYLKEEIQRRLKIYVHTINFNEAIKILNEQKVLLITGSPGIGKTTLAQMIVYHLLRDGFKIYHVENIKEAEDNYSLDPDAKQIFYFDDFLGSNLLDIGGIGNRESQIAGFIERIQHSKNKFFLLTSRTVILNQAYRKYEKIKNSSLSSSKFELRIEDYSMLQKAEILYNHLYFDEVRGELRDVISAEKFYKRIISHKNYSPRLISFFTSKYKVGGFNPDQYRNFVITSLEKPSEIWQHSFENQIGEEERHFLMTLLVLGTEAEKAIVTAAWISRLKFEAKHHQLMLASNVEERTFKDLLNGFIKSEMYTTQINGATKLEKHIIKFINPSLKDFLIERFRCGTLERENILRASIWMFQLWEWKSLRGNQALSLHEQKMAFEKISQADFHLSYSNQIEVDEYFILEKMAFVSMHCQDIDTARMIISGFELVREGRGLSIERIIPVVDSAGRNPILYQYFDSNFEALVEWVIQNISNIKSINWFLSIFQMFKRNYTEYLAKTDLRNRLIDWLKEEFRDYETDRQSDEGHKISDFEQVQNFYSDFEDEVAEASSLLGLGDHSDWWSRRYDDSDWDQIIVNNYRDWGPDEYEAEALYQSRSLEKEMELEVDSMFQNMDEMGL
jgi:hypothetical protein